MARSGFKGIIMNKSCLFHIQSMNIVCECIAKTMCGLAFMLKQVIQKMLNNGAGCSF